MSRGAGNTQGRSSVSSPRRLPSSSSSPRRGSPSTTSSSESTCTSRSSSYSSRGVSSSSSSSSRSLSATGGVGEAWMCSGARGGLASGARMASTENEEKLFLTTALKAELWLCRTASWPAAPAMLPHSAGGGGGARRGMAHTGSRGAGRHVGGLWRGRGGSPGGLQRAGHASRRGLAALTGNLCSCCRAPPTWSLRSALRAASANPGRAWGGWAGHIIARQPMWRHGRDHLARTISFMGRYSVAVLVWGTPGAESPLFHLNSPLCAGLIPPRAARQVTRR
ncbi:hypothetical protein E2C01_078194 [Portunus trituberculatus]|uniref:Uncharacterized protein n=1 Tax=Portunus trituberculatus TaxID=210409 RepID=A0A5B7IDC4_PORTR|nr:hypothetical protein [Portunus trituberculatus]